MKKTYSRHLREDSDNSALEIIFQQLEEQGHKVFINEKTVYGIEN